MKRSSTPCGPFELNPSRQTDTCEDKQNNPHHINLEDVSSFHFHGHIEFSREFSNDGNDLPVTSNSAVVNDAFLGDNPRPMHELSIATSLLDIATDEAERLGGGRVLAIHLRLGPLSGVVKEALLSAFDLARETSELQDCRLVILEMPIVIDCPVCEQHRPVRSIQEICCQVCGTPSMNIVSGRELEMTAMELTEEQPPGC